MNNLSRQKQIEIIAALCEGVGQRAVSRLTGTDRKTVAPETTVHILLQSTAHPQPQRVRMLTPERLSGNLNGDSHRRN